MYIKKVESISKVIKLSSIFLSKTWQEQLGEMLEKRKQYYLFVFILSAKQSQ